MSMYQKLKTLIQGFKNIQNPFLKTSPPGHFYSPIPDLDYVKKYARNIFERDSRTCQGIELRVEEQNRLIEDFKSMYHEIPFQDEKHNGHRYYFNNPYFGRGSSIILYSVIRKFNPRLIVEVGSGFSSAAMLDVNDLFFDGKIGFTFIEPFPERLLSIFSNNDKEKNRLFVDIVQNMSVNIFSELTANDILFIDSSHVAKVGSDVVFLLTEVLPILKRGVIVHIHDIYWPFEYPEDWVLSGRAWNEAYMVKAFLQFNHSFEILLFNSYLALHHQDVMKRCLPLFLPDGGSSLWLRKTS